MRRFAFFCAAAVLLAACQSNPAPEATKAKPGPVAVKPAADIKGLKLGATQAEVQKRFPRAECKQDVAAIACSISNVSFGGSESGEMLVAIADGKVRMIRIAFLDNDKFDYMINGMVAKFGPPTEPSSPDRLAQAYAVGWVTNDWYLLAERTPKDMQNPDVILADRPWTEKHNAANRLLKNRPF
jgi:hypothetical protein